MYSAFNRKISKYLERKGEIVSKNNTKGTRHKSDPNTLSPYVDPMGLGEPQGLGINVPEPYRRGQDEEWGGTGGTEAIYVTGTPK